MPMEDPQMAWWYLARRQKQAYLSWRMQRDGQSARHLWAQTSYDPVAVKVTGGKHAGFLQRSVERARAGASGVVAEVLGKAFRGR